ncbi:MAG TPA: FtsX-like permease family protein [Micromonosporaceae bacterium]|nr:FtsX-like permease family protein [Micromonosporaceae bacterium]
MRLSGRFRSALIIGMQGIRARKLRTLLSLMSLFLGVLAVVTVQAAAEIAERALLANADLTMGRDGTRQIYLSPSVRAAAVIHETLHGSADGVALTTMNAVIGEPGVEPVNPGGAPFEVGDRGYAVECDPFGNCGSMMGDGGQADRPPGKAIELRVVAMTSDVRQFKPFRTTAGTWLDFASSPSLSPRLVLNKEAAKGFAMHRVPAEMRFDGATAHPTPRIVGVVDDGSGEPKAYTRTDEMQNWLPPQGLDGQSREGVEVLLTPASTDLERTLRSRLVAVGTPADHIHVHTVNSREGMARELTLMRWIFLGMASLVLLIGVAGILNVGLATVGERVEEFALRRAVGTSRLLLAGIVLAETLLTGLLTAAAAIGVGVVGLKLASAVIGGRDPSLANLDFPWQAGVAGVIAGLAAGLLGGLIPAIRAARIPIATVMRA